MLLSCPGTAKFSSSACDWSLAGSNAPCPVCTRARRPHLFRSDLKLCASSSSACPLCLDPFGLAPSASCSRKRPRRRKREVVVTDLSHTFAAFLISSADGLLPSPWDLVGSSAGGSEFGCHLCGFSWREDLMRAYRRFSRRCNICPSCSALDSPAKWKQVGPLFCGAPPILSRPGSWRGLAWPASDFVHPRSIYARLPSAAAGRGRRRGSSAVDVETVHHRVSRMCPELLLLPAETRPRWLSISYSSEAERFAAALLVKNLRVPLFREVGVDLGGWEARFDFGFVEGGEVRLVEIDGAQHFNPEAFQFRFAPGKRPRHGAAWRRDREKDAFVAGSEGVRLLRISAAELPDARRVLRRWCSPEPFGPTEARVVLFGEAYTLEEVPPRPLAPTGRRKKTSGLFSSGVLRSRDLEQQQFAQERGVVGRSRLASWPG